MSSIRSLVVALRQAIPDFDGTMLSDGEPVPTAAVDSHARIGLTAMHRDEGGSDQNQGRTSTTDSRHLRRALRAWCSGVGIAPLLATPQLHQKSLATSGTAGPCGGRPDPA
ncbi:MAG: hypothetical protein JO090_11545 [Rhizobacter sp.]|nr:hypothetical protein [Rhizobacter sp.]